MKNLLVLFLLFIPLAAFCQTEEKQYYVYNIGSFEGSFTNIRIGGTVLNNPLLVKYDNTIWQYDATIYKYDWRNEKSASRNFYSEHRNKNSDTRIV